MSRRHRPRANEPPITEFPLSFFACPNPECAHFNHFNAGNLPIVAAVLGEPRQESPAS